MANIVISTNSSLDGVVEDPDGREGSSWGGWFTRAAGDDLAAWTQVEYEEALAAEALLLGRRSDEWFAARWPSRTGGFADRLNGMPKYVVSSTAGTAAWPGATVLHGVQDVAKLRAELTGDVLVYASYELGRALLAHDLVDEVRLVVFPVLAGGGRRLFGATPKPLRLLRSRTVGEHLAFLTYEVVR